uniref:Uncharacterized protein n=1 Tax=Ditylenchus dipsaci TaxID=166011 RepID=A0A915DZC4_9BILA
MNQSSIDLDVSQLPSTSNFLQQQHPMINNTVLCEQKPRIHALAKRRGIPKNATGSPSVSATHPAPNPESDEQRLPLSCQLIEPLRLRISSSSTRRGGSLDSQGPSTNAHPATPAAISFEQPPGSSSQSSSTPTTATIYPANQQQPQPFNFLPASFLPAQNFQQKQEFMAHLFGASINTTSTSQPPPTSGRTCPTC